MTILSGADCAAIAAQTASLSFAQIAVITPVQLGDIVPNNN